MFILKLISFILSGVSAFAILLLQVLWSDRRTIKFKQLRRTLLILTPVSFLLGTLLLFIDHRQNVDIISDFRMRIDSLGVYSKDISHRYDSLQRTLDSANSFLVKFDMLITPFFSLAKRRYPKLDSSSALKRLESDVKIYINTNIEKVDAPNALIVTKNQIGDNTVVNPVVGLPPARVKWEWKVVNSVVTSIHSNIGHKSIKLPSDKIPFSELYHNQVELDYYSEISRNYFFVALKKLDIIHFNIKHNGRTESGSGKNDLYYLIRLTQPENGKYLIDYYSPTKILNLKEQLLFQ